MSKPFVVDKKTFKVEGRTVRVRKQYVKGDEKPHQFQIQARIKGITATITNSYPEAAVVNRDSDYSNFDEIKARKFVANTLKFFTTKKGAELVAEDRPKLPATPAEFTDRYWFANDRFHAKDCPTCGGDGGTADGSGTCDECNGSGVMPADDCLTDVAALIVADNQRRGHDDDPSDLDPQGDEDWDHDDDDDDRAHPREPEDDEQLCPVCGGYGGESYGSDSGTCPECGGSGVVDENWGEGEADEDDENEAEDEDSAPAECPVCKSDVEGHAICSDCGHVMGLDAE